MAGIKSQIIGAYEQGGMYVVHVAIKDDGELRIPSEDSEDPAPIILVGNVEYRVEIPVVINNELTDSDRLNWIREDVALQRRHSKSGIVNTQNLPTLPKTLTIPE